MEFRLLDTGTKSAAMNMAIDEVLMLSGKPTLRFYDWDPPAVSIGYFQGIEQEVDLCRAKAEGVDVVRRLTGGGAVFHDKELTYSFIVPESMGLVSRNILESYGQICGFIIDGLRSFNINAEFKPINDIIVNGKKISGNAQTRRDGMVLQHGTILLDVDVKRMFSILKVPDEKIRDKMISAAEERVTSIKRELGTTLGADELKKTLLDHFKLGTTKSGNLSKTEIQTAEKLSKEKYLSKEWNFRR